MQDYLNSVKNNQASIGQSLTNFANKFKKPTYSSLAPLNSPTQGPSPVPTSNIASNPSAVSPAVKPPTPVSTPAKNPVLSSPAAQNFVNSYAGNSTPSSPVTSPTPTPTPSTNNSQNAYIKYLTGMFDPAKTDAARGNYEESSKRLGEIQSEREKKELEQRRTTDTILDQTGGLKAGAKEDATLYGRRSNAELADIALRESAAARSTGVAKDVYDSYINAGKSVYEAETAAKKATQDQTNKEKDQSIEQKKNSSYTLNPGDQRYENGKLVASGGPKPMSAAQEAKQIEEEKAKVQSQQQSTQTIGLINSILPRASAITGVGQNPLNYVGLSNGKTLNEYQQLQGLLKLGVRSLIKGQGAVSDYEGKLLGEAASSLGRNLSNKDFEDALKKTRGVLKTNNGMVTPVSVTNPDTGETITAELSGSEIYHLVSEGNQISYQ